MQWIPISCLLIKADKEKQWAEVQENRFTLHLLIFFLINAAICNENSTLCVWHAVSQPERTHAHTHTQAACHCSSDRMADPRHHHLLTRGAAGCHAFIAVQPQNVAKRSLSPPGSPQMTSARSSARRAFALRCVLQPGGGKRRRRTRRASSLVWEAEALRRRSLVQEVRQKHQKNIVRT